jgi:hypothetical protein
MRRRTADKTLLFWRTQRVLQSTQVAQKTYLEQNAEPLHLSDRLKPRSTAQIFTIMLCVFALLVAQTIGRQPTYVCDCGGKLMLTQSSHCYGPHDAECHSDPAKGEQGTGERKDHEAVSHEMQARPIEAAPQLVSPQVLTAILPVIHALFTSAEFEIPAVCYEAAAGESPPLSVIVARTVVFII